MNGKAPLFFCAIGGSGMLPLALIMKARGYDVRGSDRSNDQGRTPERFDFIKKQGITLFPQDGSGVTPDINQVIVSAAVEKTVPDVQAALQKNIPVVTRPALLAGIFNAANESIAVAGTSGKSTTTGMIGWILNQARRNPTVMNGAVMKNFVTPTSPFASAVVGDPDFFISEVDESDGSIALFNPKIAVLNNIALDHKTMDELRALFADFIAKTEKVVINLDNAETHKLAATLAPDKRIGYSLSDQTATLYASNIRHLATGAQFDVTHTQTGQSGGVALKVPGLHNIANALAALGAAIAAGVDIVEANKHLNTFSGIARRLDVIGASKGGITVIDDFAHNPDKIAASLKTLRQTPGRLLILFQPHGYGPLRMMRQELAACFAENLSPEDKLYITDALYLGGTTDKSVTSADLAQDIAQKGINARHAPREQAAQAIVQQAFPGDRIVVMGARDDTLTRLAAGMLDKLSH